MFFESYLFKHGQSLIFFSIVVFIAGHYFKLNKLRIFAVAFFCCCYYFFRKARFSITEDRKVLRAPAFGKISKIQKIQINGMEYLQIAIFINIFDTHIQYAPCSGMLRKMEYKKGEFYPAYMFSKSNANERLIYHMSTEHGPIIFTQIAGQVARTIVPFVKPKTTLRQSQEIGLIKFGSRSDVFIPMRGNMQVLVNEKDKVVGGQTPLVRFY